jgi:heat shock protein HspQ
MKKRAVDRNGPKNRAFNACVKEIIKELNEGKREDRLTIPAFARKIGRYERIFTNIRTGREKPTYHLIKSIARSLPWHEYRVYGHVEALVGAMAKDLRRTIAVKDVAIELAEQVKQEKENV